MLPDDPEGDAYLVGGQARVLGESYDGFDPEFRFAVPAMDVKMHSRLATQANRPAQQNFP